MSSQACGAALPFVLQVGAFSCCSIGDIVAQMRTGVPRIDVNGVLLEDGPGTDNGVLLVDGPTTDTVFPVVEIGISVIDSSTVFSTDANSSCEASSSDSSIIENNTGLAWDNIRKLTNN